MAKEIERKFLVDGDGWKDGAEKGVRLTQAYLMSGPQRSARVHIFDGGRARLTMKFGGAALSRDEYEYDIILKIKGHSIPGQYQSTILFTLKRLFYQK